MSELLEVDYGGEDLLNENRNQNIKNENELNSNQEKKDEIKIEIVSIQKKISENLKKDPIFFIMKISEESLISCLMSNFLTLSEDVFNVNEKYLETYSNVYVILLSKERNIIKAFTKKSIKDIIKEGNLFKIPIDLRYEANLPLNEIYKETSKISEKELRFDKILTKIRTSVGEKLRDIISRRNKKKEKSLKPENSELQKENLEVKKKNEKVDNEVKTEEVKVETIEENKAKTEVTINQKGKRSHSKVSNEKSSNKHKLKRKSHSRRSSSSSSSKKESHRVNQNSKNPFINSKKSLINPLLKVPQQQYFPFEYPIQPEQNLSYYFQQSCYPHNPINPIYQQKYPMNMNPAYLTWMNPEMKGNLMYPQHSELMKNYYFDNKLGFDSMRDYDEMGQIHPPINISNINFIKNNQKKDNYSRKKRRRKSSSDSSSSSSDSSSTSRKKDSTNKAKKKTENRNENKKEDKYKRRNSVNKESSNKGNIKNYDEKIREKETTSSRLKTNNLNIKEYSNEEGKYNNKNVKPNPETNNFNLETVPNQNKIIGKFVDNVESGENTDDLLKNSPILSSKVPEKSLAKKERKTKFSSENPNSKQQCFEIDHKITTTISNNACSVITENTNNPIEKVSSPIQAELGNKIESINYLNMSIEPKNLLVKDEETKQNNNLTTEKKQISLMKKTVPLNVQKKAKISDSNRNEITVEEKEEGEIEERANKNFKIIQSSGKKQIFLTNKRKINEIKVVKKENY